MSTGSCGLCEIIRGVTNPPDNQDIRQYSSSAWSSSQCVLLLVSSGFVLLCFSVFVCKTNADIYYCTNTSSSLEVLAYFHSFTLLMAACWAPTRSPAASGLHPDATNTRFASLAFMTWNSWNNDRKEINLPKFTNETTRFDEDDILSMNRTTEVSWLYVAASAL